VKHCYILYIKSKLFLFLLLSGITLKAQNSGQIEGYIYNAKNNEPVQFASVAIWQTSIGSISDLDGKFLFTGLKPGFVELRVSAVGYKTYIAEEIMVTNAKKVFLDIPLEEKTEAIEQVSITASTFRKSEESPVSLRRIGISEIERNPGSNRDISKAIQSFPGVASTPAFRNDVIVRGGGPNENAFYLDGVEIPNLNHFATQGASGGPVGIINVDFIRGINYYSGAFPANRSDALSSVIELRQKDGNSEKLNFRGTVGASDLGITLDGPLNDNTTFIASARRSYLQFLFSALELPFLPTYNDFQFKVKTRINEKNELSLIGLGAIDQFELNTEANETPGQRYILNYIPVNEQWNYTIGAVYKHYREKGFDTYVLSQNVLNNRSYKYQNNNKVDSLLILDYNSSEIENKFRYEKNTLLGSFKINTGLSLEHARYTNETYRKNFINNAVVTEDYTSSLDVFKYGFFGQTSKKVLEDRLTLSLGLRADANNYSSSMNNPLDQLSPRFSCSYLLLKNFYLNFNTGRYYQLPPYTTLGYRNDKNELINKQAGLKYISSDHFVAGLEYRPNQNSNISLEGFYKLYNQYPLSLKDSVSIASKSGDFGVFGDEAVISEAEGRSYGMELLYRNKMIQKMNILISYTLVRSEFKDMDNNLQPTNNYTPTAWDNIHLLNIIVSRNFKGNWEAGLKWRFIGGQPYTPYDLNNSAYVNVWNTTGRPYPDYSRFNDERLEPFHQLDIRIDKQFYYANFSLMFYIDIQNIYNFKSDVQAEYINENAAGETEIENPDDPSEEQRYVLTKIPGEGSGTILPTIGIIVEF
jgi:hypothetical protein